MSATQMGTLHHRDVVRCDDCRLVQFTTRSGRCRKCLVPYEEVPPPAPAVTVPAIAAGPAATRWLNSRPARKARAACVGEAAGCLLRVIRQARGLSPIQMAELLRLPREYIDNYEQGKSAPRPGTIVRICEKLAIEPAAFIAAVEIAARGSLNTAVEIAARGSVQ